MEVGELRENEKVLFKKVQDNNLEETRAILSQPDVRVDCLDDQGMTPLQHAAYRGNYDMCKLLLDRGADVNSNYHSSGYQALMFAGLAGKVDVVNLLLEHGASITHTNSVGRNASQMAAFVGNHEVVAVINYFIPKEDLEYYTKKQGLEKEAKLSANVCTPLYKLLLRTNIHPIYLSMYLQKNVELLEVAKQVYTVLDLLCQKEIKKPDANELLALKLHYISFLVKTCDKYIQSQNLNLHNKSHSQGCLEKLMKSWLKGRDSDGFPVVLEQLLRQSIREFPFLESSILQNLVRTLAPVSIGDEPSALSILIQTVSGQKGCTEVNTCTTCGEPKAEKRCSICKSVQYCDQDCQKLHWSTHKKHCQRLAKEYKEQQELEKCLEQENLEKQEKHKSLKEENVSDEDMTNKSNGDLAENIA